MKKIISKRNIVFITAATVAGVATTLFMGYTERDNFNMPYSQIPFCAVSPELPGEITFAGEKILLTAQDRRERLDREILAFTYSHINTLLQLKRANRLFPIVEPILKECGIPDDFKYLMIIESNGDIYAKSTVGACGLWQFMDNTARGYGLEVGKHVDERYHIEKATRAACAYLKESYDEFGDWLTVAATYNAGRAGISKRIEKQKEQKAIDLQLVPETSRYIFRLLAAKTIFSNPVNFGFTIKNRDLYPPLPIAKTLTISTDVPCWADIAKKHGLTFMQLREANPWIRETEMPNKTGKRYEVLIPDSAGLHYNPEETVAHNACWVVK